MRNVWKVFRTYLEISRRQEDMKITGRGQMGPENGNAMPDRYTMLVDDAFPLGAEGVVVTGIVKGGIMGVRDNIWVLWAEGTIRRSFIAGMAAFKEQIIRKAGSAEENMRVGILLKGMEEVIVQGCVLTNIEPNVKDLDRPFENPRLKGLLAGRHDALLVEVDQLIEQEITGENKFLAAVVSDHPQQDDKGEMTMSLPYLTAPDGQSYQPVFTDWTEIREWGLEDDGGLNSIIIGKAEVLELVRQNERLRGVVINPFTDNWFIAT